MAAKIWMNVAGTGSFETRNSSGVLFDPGAVSMWIKPPNSSEVAVTASNAGVGLWTFSYTPTEPGSYTARIEGVTAGTIVCRGEGAFYVSPDSF